MFAAVTATAEPLVFQSAGRQAALLELYTSEGCSSCPPAERWVSELKGAPGLWNEFVPVVFHVDYWNNLGWRDKLSSPQFSDRQRGYARAWSAENIYTPEFVLNGREWGNWLGSRGAPSASKNRVGILQVNSDDGKHWQVSFNPVENESVTDYEATVAVLVSGLNSEVTAGENSGRDLKHDFAVLSLVTCSLVSRTNGFRGTLVIDPDSKEVAGRRALAAWVTRRGELKPLQATGGWLPEPIKTIPPAK
ncbi:MAG TPA: DUF1223 domain-containing protein [Candidatus Sulfotelmatobacter sp.]|nr:DUF1223 domain-containing protein [Candidatus Sulfotelmatobacter sp.]